MGSIMGLWGIFWIIFGITLVQKLSMRYIYKQTSSTEIKVILWLIFIGIGAVNIFWLNPTIVNSIMNSLGFIMRFTWQQILPISFIISLQWAPVGLDTVAKTELLWEKRSKELDRKVIDKAIDNMFKNAKS